MNISICVPVLNEELNIKPFYDEMKNFMHKNNYKNYEIIFSDNYSTDNTEQEIIKICQINKNVKYIKFTHNLGYDRSIYENYLISSGDFAISIDCDLQDDLETINKFIAEWKSGHDMVYGIRYDRKGNYIFTLLTRLYYRIFNFFQFRKLPNDSGDFRLVDKYVISQLRKNKIINPYTRFLTFVFSKNPKGIFYKRDIRKLGYSKFGLFNSLKYGFKMLTLYTNFFPRFFGFIFIMLSLFFVTTAIFVKNINNNFIFLSISLIFLMLACSVFYLLENFFHNLNESRLKNNVIIKKINFNE
jgi:dolichol-phosphate mannosyltransferase